MPREVKRRFEEFCGLGPDATFLGARWFVLRAIGLVYVLAFAGVIAESQALVGPHGLAPIGELLSRIRSACPGILKAFDIAPSLFWIKSGATAIGVLEWAGMAAAIALVLNIWPRMALFACWLIFLSFVSTWSLFSPAQLDDLMLETALLSIPFAPAGFRPGLGAASPPRPIALFMMRFLLFRVMFESGIVKLIGGDPHWRNFTALDIMHEVAPLPTYLGYLDHHLPHAFHVLEALLTYTAELLAPVVAVFGGRRGRWFAFSVWVAFQVGIQLTTDFGWLNVAAIALGVLLLDDQMLARAGDWLGIRDSGDCPAGPPPQVSSRFKRYGLRGALGAHFVLTLFYLFIFIRIDRGQSMASVPGAITGPVNLFWNFHSANEYNLYAKIGEVRYGVEFAGSNDAGRTWRTYEYRYVPQQPDRICPFIGPWFPRFDVTIEDVDWRENKSWLFQAVATELLGGNPDVTGLFARNPFPISPPSIIRMRYYRLAFTDLDTHRTTGRFWRKEYKGDYLPMLFVDEHGQVSESNLGLGDNALKDGDFGTAVAVYEREYRIGIPDAGFRLANLYGRGLGVQRNPEKAFAIYAELAARGEIEAGTQLGACYERGNGVPVDYDRAMAWYKASARQGSLLALYSLGGLYARDLVIPNNDVEGLTLLRETEALASGDDPLSRYVLQDPNGYARQLEDRMAPWEISNAGILATDRIKKGEWVP